MAEFQINEPIQTEEPRIEVTITERNPLAPGRHQFQLVVVDDSGNESTPDQVEVMVLDTQRPNAVLSVRPRRATFGRSFQLDGSRSVDTGGGQIVTYVWTYLGPVEG